MMGIRITGVVHALPVVKDGVCTLDITGAAVETESDLVGIVEMLQDQTRTRVFVVRAQIEKRDTTDPIRQALE